MTQGRWLELGTLEPAALHAAYAGLARVQPADGAPFVVRADAATGHLSLGATQAAGEADLTACRDRGWGPWRRPLGGGAVWVDGDQHPIFIGLPGGNGRRAEAEPAILEALAATHRAFGLPAEVVGRDVWVGGRKVVGTGSATLGGTWILGAALLWRLPVRRFARAVAAPSAGYRRWLARELAAGLSTWEDHAPRPPTAEADAVLAAELGHRLGVEWVTDAPTEAEWSAIREEEAEVRAEAEELAADEPSRLPGGIKVNHRTYLVEGEGVRLVLRDGLIARAARTADEQPLAAWTGHAPVADQLPGERSLAQAAGAAAEPVFRLAGWER